jgi:hypothetical protein
LLFVKRLVLSLISWIEIIEFSIEFFFNKRRVYVLFVFFVCSRSRERHVLPILTVSAASNYVLF